MTLKRKYGYEICDVICKEKIKMIEMIDTVITKTEHRYKLTDGDELIIPKGIYANVVEILGDDYSLEMNTKQILDSDGDPLVLEYKKDELELYKKNGSN